MPLLDGRLGIDEDVEDASIPEPMWRVLMAWTSWAPGVARASLYRRISSGAPGRSAAPTWPDNLPGGLGDEDRDDDSSQVVEDGETRKEGGAGYGEGGRDLELRASDRWCQALAMRAVDLISNPTET